MWIRRPSDPPGRARAARLLLALAVLAVLTPSRARADAPATPAAPDPAMEALRERFRAGMDKYREGRFGDAIVTWEQIYRELGSETGYRLAFNLARAYDAVGDLTKAAEHYTSYVEQVERRRARGEPLEPLVDKQDGDARERLAQLGATRGRIRVVASDRPTAAQVDAGEPRLAGFVAYVAPGQHVVTFGTGPGAERVQVSVSTGELVEIAPPPSREATGVGAATAGVDVPAARGTPARSEPATAVARPFSATWLYVAGGVTLASAVVPAVAYANALGTKSDYDASNDRAEKEALATSYEGQRSAAHASAVVTGGLAVVTTGLLAAWLLWPPRGVAATPTAAVGPGSATLGVGGRF